MLQLPLGLCLKDQVSPRAVVNRQVLHVYFKLVWKHWLFAEEVQEHLHDQVIPFDI